jgi:hypothetical protein
MTISRDYKPSQHFIQFPQTKSRETRKEVINLIQDDSEKTPVLIHAGESKCSLSKIRVIKNPRRLNIRQ